MKKRKNTPSSSKKKSKKKQGIKENLVILGTFILFIAVVAYLFYSTNTPSSDSAAFVNGEEITIGELDWWYRMSIPPEGRELVTKMDFLMISLIPQELLMREAEKEGIEATPEEVEKLVGLFVIDSGMNLGEFEKHLKSRGFSIDDVKKSFESRAVILELLEKEDIDIAKEEEKLFFSSDDNSFQDYIDTLINNSEIRIFPENINRILLRSFEATGEDICDGEKPIIRLYTTSWCGICNESSAVFENLANEFAKDSNFDAAHWSLDIGDNLLTQNKENGVPQKEVEMFRKYSPNNLVPAVVLGCRYKRVGSFGLEDEYEAREILKSIAGG
ncbi:SurA N-terminal domain-containing protein [Candidatus Woesearchaeota archaeon]|nr:SurA N-terminal domain-containing protein [Candidatus Woesearchaeota archaeon]